jgi:hypothetical protein
MAKITKCVTAIVLGLTSAIAANSTASAQAPVPARKDLPPPALGCANLNQSILGTWEFRTPTGALLCGTRRYEADGMMYYVKHDCPRDPPGDTTWLYKWSVNSDCEISYNFLRSPVAGLIMQDFKEAPHFINNNEWTVTDAHGDTATAFRK